MFYYAIPLTSKQACTDWNRVTALLEITLGSIHNSISPEFKVLIACHDLPETSYNSSDKVKFIVADFPPLMGQNRPMLDKINKLKLAALEVRKAGGGYLMLMDADDLVSNRLVEYVTQDRHEYGYFMGSGYELDYARGRARYCPRYHRLCGSSIIMRLSPGDIPESWTDQTECYYSTMVWRGHRYCELASREMGRPLKEIPFRAGVYVINNGENHSKRSHNIGWRRKVVRAMTPTFRINDRLRNEFHLEVPSPMERALSTC